MARAGDEAIETIADTSVVLAFAKIRKLDLIAHWRPIHATPSVFGEVEPSRRGAIKSEVKRARDAGWLLEAKPPSESATLEVLTADELHEISETDAELIALARETGAKLLSHDTRLLTIAERFGVRAFDITDILVALKQGRHVGPQQMKEIVEGLEREDNRKFDPQDRAYLLA